MNPPTLFFFSKILLSVLSSLKFCMDFRISLSTSEKKKRERKAVIILVEIALTLWINLRNTKYNFKVKYFSFFWPHCMQDLSFPNQRWNLPWSLDHWGSPSSCFFNTLNYGVIFLCSNELLLNIAMNCCFM